MAEHGGNRDAGRTVAPAPRVGRSKAPAAGMRVVALGGHGDRSGRAGTEDSACATSGRETCGPSPLSSAPPCIVAAWAIPRACTGSRPRSGPREREREGERQDEPRVRDRLRRQPSMDDRVHHSARLDPCPGPPLEDRSVSVLTTRAVAGKRTAAPGRSCTQAARARSDGVRFRRARARPPRSRARAPRGRSRRPARARRSRGARRRRRPARPTRGRRR